MTLPLGPLQLYELKGAEFLLLRYVKSRVLTDTCKCTEQQPSQETVEKLSKMLSLRKLSPIIRDGLICVGDFVLFTDETLARGTWSKGLVQDTVTSEDCHVREMLLRTPEGIIRRDIRCVCLLERVEDT